MLHSCSVRKMAGNQRIILRVFMLVAIVMLAALLLYSQGVSNLQTSWNGNQESILQKRKPLDYTPQTDKAPVQRQSENVWQYQAKIAQEESASAIAGNSKGPALPGTIPKSPLGDSKESENVKIQQSRPTNQQGMSRTQGVLQSDPRGNRSVIKAETLRLQTDISGNVPGSNSSGSYYLATQGSGAGSSRNPILQPQQVQQPLRQQQQPQRQQQQPQRQQQQPQRQQPQPQQYIEPSSPQQQQQGQQPLQQHNEPSSQQQQQQRQQQQQQWQYQHQRQQQQQPQQQPPPQPQQPQPQQPKPQQQPQQQPQQPPPPQQEVGKPVSGNLVGEHWDKKDPKNLPNLVALNLNDPSLPRRSSDKGGAIERLIPGLVPSIVHFVWCGRRWFEFKPYLSIQSAIRFIQPDKVVFHYEYEPEQDMLFYQQWIADLEHDFPFFVKQRMTVYETRICYGTHETQVAMILELLQYEGGIYIGESTWMLDFPASNLDVDLELSLEPNGIDGYVILRPGIAQYNQSLETLASNLARAGSFKVKRSQCASVNQLYNGLRNPHCLIVKGGVFDVFYPSDIWELKHTFGAIVRRIFYGTEEILKPKPSYDTLVPNFGHMIWLGGGAMDFVFYLSVLSMLYVVEVDTLYIHGDYPPAGPYWQKLMNNPNVQPRLKFITRPQPLMVYQGVIEDYYKALMSDIIRVDIMIKYGGIYADTDAIWVKPLSQEDRGYDAVASYDWVDWSFPYPDSVNFGLSYGKKNAPFWRIFRESMRKLHNDVHGFTGVMNPYKLLEKYPHLLRIDRHLQVICYQCRCHPTWVRNYHNMSIDHVTTGSLDNWRQDVNAIHWTHPNPPELANETALASGTGLFADLGRMVLSKAGLL